MQNKLQKIDDFLQDHHVLSLATYAKELSVCSLFYFYDNDTQTFTVASSDETQHIKNISQNNRVAGGVVLETKSVGKIQGIQFRGNFLELSDEKSKREYFKKFPYALAMQPKLWRIEVDYFKFTDNRLGFGKKIIWEK